MQSQSRCGCAFALTTAGGTVHGWLGATVLYCCTRHAAALDGNVQLLLLEVPRRLILRSEGGHRRHARCNAQRNTQRPRKMQRAAAEHHASPRGSQQGHASERFMAARVRRERELQPATCQRRSTSCCLTRRRLPPARACPGPRPRRRRRPPSPSRQERGGGARRSTGRR